MNQLMLSLLILLTSNSLFGQNNIAEESRFISVTGSAEVVVSPDEIELEITLKEYTSQKDTKIELPKIESKFIDILNKNKIEKRNIIFGNSDYYWYYWWSYRNDTYKQKKYKIKLDNSTNFLALVQDLDTEGVHSLRISNTTNKQLQELRKDIKISALRAAKEKAIYLLESIDEQIGKIISIEEVPDNRNYYWRGSQNLLSNAVVSTNAASNDDIENVATIKLRYEVKTKFEIE